MKAAAKKDLLQTLQDRFEQHMGRHKGLKWGDVLARLDADPSKLVVLHEMERTGGEPDVVDYDKKAASIIFCDCAAESPSGRRSLCYDGAALASRKANKPSGSAAEMAAAIGIDMLTEAQYRELQELGEFDTKTSSWILTPPTIRALGGAIFCDRRFGQVFLYHNGAESYYAGRGFRGRISV